MASLPRYSFQNKTPFFNDSHSDESDMRIPVNRQSSDKSSFYSNHQYIDSKINPYVDKSIFDEFLKAKNSLMSRRTSSRTSMINKNDVNTESIEFLFNTCKNIFFLFILLLIVWPATILFKLFRLLASIRLVCFLIWRIFVNSLTNGMPICSSLMIDYWIRLHF